jgi:large subunit ribosomal protein L25
MPDITLRAEVGRPLGSRATRRLRLAGKVPGVVYGHATEPVPVAVEARDLRTALAGESGANTLLELQAGDHIYLTMARDMQHHPVKGTVTHVDFLIVRRDEVLSAEVPINLVGEAIEVHHGDGLVDQQLFSLTVRAKPADIPAAVEVDVSALTIGGSIRVAELVLPVGVTTDVDGEVAVVTGQPPRVVTAAEGEGEALPGEAPAELAESESPATADEG